MFHLGLAAHVHLHPLPQKLLQAAALQLFSIVLLASQSYCLKLEVQSGLLIQAVALQCPGGAQDTSTVEEEAPG